MTGNKSTLIITIAIFVCLFSSSATTANPITLESSVQRGWVRTMGESGDDVAFDVALDKKGNIYTVGKTADKVSPSFENTTNNPQNIRIKGHDAFIAKYDSTGEHRWTKTLNCNFSSANRISIDKSGNLFVAGTFRGTCDFNPGDKVENRTSHRFKTIDAVDVFVLKLNSMGQFQWVTTFGGDDSILKSDISMEIDDSSNVYIGGHSNGVIEFNLESDIEQNTTGKKDNIFICKINSSGNIDWAKRWGRKCEDIAVTSDGTLYISGWAYGLLTLNTENQSFENNGDSKYRVYLWRINPDGEFDSQWLWDSQNLTGRCRLYLDKEENLYLSGSFENEMDIDPGKSEKLISTVNENSLFLAMFDEQVNLKWVKTFGGDDKNSTMDIIVDKTGFIFLAGLFGGTGDFNPGNGTSEMTSQRRTDSFLSKFTGDGDYKWSTSWEGDGQLAVFSIAADRSGNVYLSGRYSQTVDFAPGPTNDPQTSVGISDAFLLKLTPQGKYFGWLDF